MGKQQDWSVTACVFLFLSLASNIHGTRETFSHKTFPHIYGSSGVGHINAIRRVSVPLLETTKGGINQQNIKEKDLIKQLPGQPPVSFKQYGGYVAINETNGRFFYYYFVEAIKTNSSSPLVIWLNGGPGCSSLVGAYTEHGPFRIHSDGKTLYRNSYSWNNEANVLYLESPAEVGFSYTNTPSDLENLGDKKTAEDNYVFLVKWLERFPEYKKKDFYIAGESYAGHYCLQLAQMIVHNRNQTFINLRGVLVGNPALDEKVEKNGHYEYLLNHALISKEYFDNYNKMCVNMTWSDKAIIDCSGAIDNIDDQTKHLDMYNIYAPRCLNSTLTSKPKKHTTITKFDPCNLEYMTAYLNQAKVQEAMHANTTKLPYAWKLCSDSSDSWIEKDKLGSLIPTLKELISEGVRVWLYNGDLDATVPHTSTMDVLQSMNLTVDKIWRTWFSEGEVGGYTEKYKEKITYATVRGAGHMVPTDQPIRAFTLFTSFIRNNPLPDTI
ncbi:unnamed protein product [Arabis nemorensis]|uniref:Carboxypeptidase n=1 Tax=Arabis nemorensis TaxID=586526 RepID=A0A565ASY7_9BRAS|nr:unnamed protein product [Arabis nemorensis]